MGAPAILRINSDYHDGAFYSEWASPEKVIPGFARWAESCKTDKTMPTATTYSDFTVTDPGDHLHDDYDIDLADPDNLAHRYTVRSTAAGTGWLADLTIWCLQERPGHSPRLTVWHRISFTNEDTTALHHLALCSLTRTIQTVYSLNRANYTGPALDFWREQAAWHAAQAKAVAA